MQPSNEMLERLRKLAKDAEPMDRDELFGESPDDAYDRGFTDGESSLAALVLQDLARGE